jgi:hypothetical protein
MTVIRSTTQIVEVAEVFDANLRQTQQFIQVAYLVSESAIYEEDPSNTLSLTQSAVTENILNLPASNALSLSQDTVTYGVIRVGNSLFLTQATTAETIINQAPIDTLSLSQDALYNQSVALQVEHTLALSQSATNNLQLPTQEVSNSLSLTQSADWARLAESILVLTQEASVVDGAISETASNDLSLTQSATTLTVLTSIASSALALTQNAVGSIIVVGATNITSTLVLTQMVVGTIKENYVILSSEGVSVLLPAPELDDKENSVSEMAVKRAMDGTVRTYVKKSPNRLLSYTFDLSREKGLELQAFLSTYNGNSIRLHNWKAEVWDTHLMTNPVNYTQNRKGPNVGVNLQFEGEKISG